MNLKGFLQQLNNSMTGTFNNVGHFVSALTGSGQQAPKQQGWTSDDPILQNQENLHKQIIADNNKSALQDTAYQNQMNQIAGIQKKIQPQIDAKDATMTLLNNYWNGAYNLPTAPGMATTNVGSRIPGLTDQQSSQQVPGQPITQHPIFQPSFQTPSGDITPQVQQQQPLEAYQLYMTSPQAQFLGRTG